MCGKCDALPKRDCSTCLSKSKPGIHSRHSFWGFQASTPARSCRFLRAAAGSTSSTLCLHYACKRSHAFVEDSGFVYHAEKHRPCHGAVVSEVCYGWKWGCQPCKSCQCSLTHRGFLRAAHQLCITASWPSCWKAAAEKTVPIRRSRGFGRGVVISRTCSGIFRPPMFLCDHCQTMKTLEIELLTTGLEVGLPVFHFQLPRFSNVTTAGAKRFVLHACLDEEI